MTPVLLALSLTHASAGFDVLERATAAVAGLSRRELVESTLARDEVSGAVVVSTCNRLEAYLDVPAEHADEAATHIVRALAQRSGLPDLGHGVRARTDGDAVHHLFAVASGLDSLVLGESEITGQVSRAYDEARRLGATTPALDQVFQRAIRTSREVRSHAPAQPDASVVHLALDLAASRIADWRATRVLLVGTGAHARTAVRALGERGARRVAVWSGTGRAEAFALRHGLTPAAGALADAVTEADLVLTCTSRTALGLRDVTARRLLVIDLGLPRNVDPAVGELPGVELLDLATIARHADVPGLGGGVERDGEELANVRDAVVRYVAEVDAAPAVVALRRHVEELLESELVRARRRAHDEHEAARTEAALRHLVGVLLHTPSIRARELAADGELGAFAAGVEAVFGLGAVRDGDGARPAEGDGEHGGTSEGEEQARG